MSAPDSLGGLHDTPTAAELVEAVREFLEGEVLGALEGSKAFQTKVAINTLKIVQRELEAGGTDVAAHQARLADLGYADDAALADAIRSGSEDDRYELIKSQVTESVRAKLEVANPRYLKEIS
jgi:hypothetical protein